MTKHPENRHMMLSVPRPPRADTDKYPAYTEQAAELRRQIDLHFPDVLCPSPSGIVECGNICGRVDCRAIAEDLGAKSWKNFSPETIYNNHCNLSYIGADVLPDVIPAFMRYAVNETPLEGHDNVGEWTYYTLCPASDNDQQFEFFTASQRSVVASWIEFVVHHDEWYHCPSSKDGSPVGTRFWWKTDK